MSAEVNVAVAGLGYWGPNLARNMDVLPGARLTWICDGSPERLEAARAVSQTAGRRSRLTKCSRTTSSTPS